MRCPKQRIIPLINANDNQNHPKTTLQQHWEMHPAEYEAWESLQVKFFESISECFAEPAKAFNPDMRVNHAVTGFSLALIEAMFHYISMLPPTEAAFCMDEAARASRHLSDHFKNLYKNR